MAIYHLSADIIGRSKGQSAVAAAAYRAGEKLYCKRDDRIIDYKKKRGVIYNEILLPPDAPSDLNDREKLWNAVEAFEKRKDATYAREIEVALPVELSFAQQKELIKDFIKTQFVSIGMIADYAIHDVDSKNPHAHILLTTRQIHHDGFGPKVREWNDKKLLLKWREEWAVCSNRYLALNGHDCKITHLSHADRGINLEPTIHRGIARRNEEILDRFQMSKSIKERNYDRLIADPSIAIDLLTNHESVFSHQDLARFVNERTNSLEEFSAFKLAIETHPELINLGQGNNDKFYYTSKSVLRQERDLLKCSTQLSKSNSHKIALKKVNFVLADRALNAEQLEAFNHIMSGQDMSLIVGFAGTGKSYLMSAVKDAYVSRGYAVLGAALAGKAADGLEQSAKIDSFTVSRLLLDWENGRRQLTRKSVLIVDEAGMLGTTQFLKLTQEAQRSGAKIIFAGDPEQIPSIEAGSPFRYLLERISHKFLRQVIRQKEDWQKQATVELSSKQHGKALDRYHANGFVHEHATKETAVEAVVENWHKYVSSHPDKSAVMMSYTNVDVLALNLATRDKMIGTSQLSSEYAVIRTKDYGELEFRLNERIIFLKNEKSLGVKNGFIGTVNAIEGSVLMVTLDDGRIITFDSSQYNDIGYGYATTVHKAQGVTVDQAYFLATKQVDCYITNVAMDRHRDNVELHYSTDEFRSYPNLKRCLSRGDSKVMAVEFAQARGLDYDINLDEAANFESKFDIANYYQEVINHSVDVKNTIAEDYLKQLAIYDIENIPVKFNPKVWERESQSYQPALVAKAVGQGADGVCVKGVQVTYLSDSGSKARIEHPTRYSGSTNALIMLQKPTNNDPRWFLTNDLETGLALCKSNPAIRVASLTTPNSYESLSLGGTGKELVFCTTAKTAPKILEKMQKAFEAQGFKFRVQQMSAKTIAKGNGLHSVRLTNDIEIEIH